MNSITAWSYSRLSLYEECPAKFKYKNIDKLPEPKHPAMARGIEIHEKLATWLKGPPGTPIPADAGNAIEKFQACGDDLKSRQPIVEQEWAFTKDMRATGYFAKDCYWRVTLDAAAIDDGYVPVLDWKSGKPYGSNMDQMEQFAVAVFARYFDAFEVDTRLWYVDTGDEITATFKRQDYTKLKAKWDGRVAPMFNDTTFAPRPGQACRRCHFRRSNGGPCAFS